MIAKLLLTAGIIGLVFLIATKRGKRTPETPPGRVRTQAAEPLIRCPSCGVYRLPEGPCDCG